MNDLLSFDRAHLWHPYTSVVDPLPVYPVTGASGVQIRLKDGRELVDGMASWWCVIHGYGHPRIVSAIQEQAATLCHVMFGGITHEPAVALGRRLLALLPSGLDKIFYCDSGSVAVEVAMKMAMQYFFVKGASARKKFLTIRSGYHGDTFHAMSVCDPVGGMHRIYTGILPEYLFADAPPVTFHEKWREEGINSFARLIEQHHDELCAVILEPVVQGAGGMRFYHPTYLKRVRELCDSYGILLIADEIATGFGRSGALFACDHADVVPDIMCLGKALTGGYMSFAAVAATDTVGRMLSSGSPGVFMHGPTFMANPLACAAACASLDLLAEMDWQTKVKGIERLLEEGLAPCRAMRHVADVRVLGAIGVVELKNPVDMSTIQRDFVDNGVWVRPFGRLVYLMPPYVIEKEELQLLTRAVCRVVKQHG